MRRRESGGGGAGVPWVGSRERAAGRGRQRAVWCGMESGGGRGGGKGSVRGSRCRRTGGFTHMASSVPHTSHVYMFKAELSYEQLATAGGGGEAGCGEG